jgi:hypothetical protein
LDRVTIAGLTDVVESRVHPFQASMRDAYAEINATKLPPTDIR